MGLKKDAFFWNRVANGYAKQEIKNISAYHQKLAMTQEYFTPESRVLEFGCGTGSTAIHHAEKVKSILASDISQEMIRIAKSKAAAAHVTNIEFICCPIESMILDQEAFDVILGLNILHLVQNQEQTLKQIYSALKPGGVFISSTPCLKEVSPKVQTMIGLGKFLKILPKISLMNATSLKQSITAAQFQIELDWQPKLGEGLFLIARKLISAA